MLKSELVQRISSQNPHLYQRDIEKIVDAILNAITEALRRRPSGVTRFRGRFRLSSAERGKGVTPVPELLFQSHRKPFPFSKLEKKCVSDLIQKANQLLLQQIRSGKS